MEKFFNALLQDIDRHTATINMEGENIIPSCREMMTYLKKKMSELKTFTLSHEFKDDAEEILFFKYRKPQLFGRLLYFYKLYQIESNRPTLPRVCDGLLPMRGGEAEAALREKPLLLPILPERGDVPGTASISDGDRRRSAGNGHVPLRAGSGVRHGYDLLVARLVSFELLSAFLTKRMHEPTEESLPTYKKLYWTDKKAAAVELIYGFT